MTNQMLKTILSPHIMPIWNGRKGRNPWEQTPSHMTVQQLLYEIYLLQRLKSLLLYPLQTNNTNHRLKYCGLLCTILLL